MLGVWLGVDDDADEDDRLWKSIILRFIKLFLSTKLIVLAHSFRKSKSFATIKPCVRDCGVAVEQEDDGVDEADDDVEEEEEDEEAADELFKGVVVLAKWDNKYWLFWSINNCCGWFITGWVAGAAERS